MFFVVFWLSQTVNLLLRFCECLQWVVLTCWLFPVWVRVVLQQCDSVYLRSLLLNCAIPIAPGVVWWCHSVHCWRNMHFSWGWHAERISTARCIRRHCGLTSPGRLDFITLGRSGPSFEIFLRIISCGRPTVFFYGASPLLYNYNMQIILWWERYLFFYWKIYWIVRSRALFPWAEEAL